MSKRRKICIEDGDTEPEPNEDGDDPINELADWLEDITLQNWTEIDSRTSLFEGQLLNVKDENGGTSLHIAARLERNSLAETIGLVERKVDIDKPKADIDALDNANRSPIYYAALKNNWDTCEYLIRRGAKVRQDISQQTVVKNILYEVAKQNILQKTNFGSNFKFEINWAVFPMYGEEYGTTKNNTILHLAVKCGRVDWVENLIRIGASVKVSNSKKHTPLHLAVIHRHKDDLIGLLLKHGAKIDAQDFEGRTPLHRAIERNLGATVDFLLNKGADVKKQDDRGMSPLHCSLILKTDSITKTLLNCAVDMNLMGMNLRNHKEETPLHCTTSKELIELLVEKGAEIDAENEKGRTALHRNIMENNIEVVHYLLKQGANPKHLDKRGVLPIRYAVNFASKGMVELFTDLDADGIDNEDREIIHLIQIAVERNQFDTVKLLCNRLKMKRITLTDREGGKILLQALSSSSDNVVKFLMREKVVNVLELIPIGYQCKKPCNKVKMEIYEDTWKMYPIEAARELNRDKIIKEMLDYGALDVDGRTERKLHSSAKSRRFRALQDVIRWSSVITENFTIVDENKNTPLHVGCVKSRKSVIKYLAAKGKQCLKLKNKDKKLPVDLAKKHHPSMVELLKVDESKLSQGT